MWEIDDSAGVLRLAGLQALAPEVLLAKRVRAQGAERLRQAAMWTLQAMNECARRLRRASLALHGTCAASPTVCRGREEQVCAHACRWSIMEAEAYLRYVESLVQQRNQRAWRFDWAWLEANGVSVPAQLQAASL